MREEKTPFGSFFGCVSALENILTEERKSMDLKYQRVACSKQQSHKHKFI